MAVLRSVLWIGPGERFAADLVAQAATLDVVWERDPRRAARLPVEGFHAVVLDAGDGDSALDALAALRAPRGAPVLVRLGAADARRIPELRAAGAADVVLDGDEAAAGPRLLSRLERLTSPDGGSRGPVAPPEMVGVGPEMAEVFRLVAVAARCRATVLVCGETGTGKELVARALHRQSRDRTGRFVALNCAAFPDTLLESELFGHVRGAFTGADRDRSGLFEAAHRGTLFLDEVSETSGPFQAKLLRVLQEREVRPVGGTRTRSFDVRVVAASNRDLRRAAHEGRFREDLYYRLAVFPIELPPLRARPRDVLALAEHFLALHGEREDRPGARLGPEAERLLLSHRWPGNVRELENEVQRALAMAPPGEMLTPAHFSDRLSRPLEALEAPVVSGETLREALGRVEAHLIRRALDAHGGHRTETARRLGITREGLYKKMKRLGIE